MEKRGTTGRNYAISVFHCHVDLLDLHAKCEILDLEQTQQLRQSRCKKQWAHLEKFRDAFFLAGQWSLALCLEVGSVFPACTDTH